MTTRAILTFDTIDGRKEIRFFKTANDARNAINNLRAFHSGKYYNFKIKIVKPY